MLVNWSDLHLDLNSDIQTKRQMPDYNCVISFAFRRGVDIEPFNLLCIAVKNFTYLVLCN